MLPVLYIQYIMKTLSTIRATEASSTTKWKAGFCESATILVESKQHEMNKKPFAEELLLHSETTGQSVGINPRFVRHIFNSF